MQIITRATTIKNLKDEFLDPPSYVAEWTDEYFHKSAFDVPINCPDKKVINFLSQFKKNIRLKLYRGINRFNKARDVIASWTYDKKIAESYIKDGGKIAEKEFVPEDILLDTTVLNTRQKELLGYDYSIDDKEVLVLNKTI